MNQKSVKIYSDGACSGNPGPGGWGAVLIWGDVVKKISGHNKNTTNNRMELTAPIEALKLITKPCLIEIYTDSKYVQNGITTWIHSWKKTAWNKGKVKNIDLWTELDNLCAEKTITWHWVKGHNGDFYNELADELATQAIKSI